LKVGGGVERVEVFLDAASFREEDRVLRDGDDAAAEYVAVDAVQGSAVELDALGARREGVQKTKEDEDEGRFATADVREVII
jgi:hypothetical protein